MLLEIRRVISIVLCWLLALTPVFAAPQSSTPPRPKYSAPIPRQVLRARTVFVANGGGSNYFEMYDGSYNRAYNTFYRDLKRIGHYQLTSSPARADVILEIRAIAPASSDNDTTDYNPQVVLTIRDPHTTAVLWRESANVRGFGTRKRRDRQLDQAVAVLVDKLAVLTGQPLNQAQTKAIAANSRMPMATKVFLFSAIAGGAAITAWGIHAMMNQPALNPPPTPTVP